MPSSCAISSRVYPAFPVQAERFQLRQRALHCFKEARRVLDFKACLSTTTPSTRTTRNSTDIIDLGRTAVIGRSARFLRLKACLSKATQLDEKRIHYLGQLLNESQESCATAYDCSPQRRSNSLHLTLRQHVNSATTPSSTSQATTPSTRSKATQLDEKRIHYLGQLLNESQESCATAYDCSARRASLKQCSAR
jgi:galactokinase